MLIGRHTMNEWNPKESKMNFITITISLDVNRNIEISKYSLSLS